MGKTRGLGGKRVKRVTWKGGASILGGPSQSKRKSRGLGGAKVRAKDTRPVRGLGGKSVKKRKDRRTTRGLR